MLLLLSIKEKIPRESISSFQDLLQKPRDIELLIEENKEPRPKSSDKKKKHTSESCYKRIEDDRKGNPRIKETILNCNGCGLAGYYRSNCPNCNKKNPINSPEKLDFNAVHTTIFGRDVPIVDICINGLNGEAYFDAAA
ncbi:hypothetical protein CVS40_11480 [Lucilia cuprina]|nr:hypothetical protein CVS40_11480 [Lucilia cuprina]